MDKFMPTEYELKKHHFAFYVGCCKAFIKLLGQFDWEVSFQFLGSDADTPRSSTTVYDRGNRLASIQLYDEWDVEPSEFRLWRTAFHEITELLLSDINVMAHSRQLDYLAYDREHHRVIRILEVAWFEGMWNYGHEIFNFQSDAKDVLRSRPELPKLGPGVQVPDPGVQGKKRSKK